MHILLQRLRINRLYTDGELYINGGYQTGTVECTFTMLPEGHYELKIDHRTKRKHTLTVFRDGKNLGVTFRVGHSWINSHDSHTICLGKPLIPGVVYRGTEDFERIHERLKKCVARHEPITLTISECSAKITTPIRHWLLDESDD